MKCDVCGIRESVMFIQEVTPTSTRELHLCAECAAEKRISASGGKLEVPLGKIFPMRPEARLCRVCGLSLANLRKYRRAGCPNCYKDFSAEIYEIISGSKGEPYTGSLPKRIAGFRSKLVDRANLENSLSESVAREDYEKAAVYRDRLKELDMLDD